LSVWESGGGGITSSVSLESESRSTSDKG
jgi:hypothetical protein